MCNMIRRQYKIKRLYARLERAGLSRRWIRKIIFPSWWSDDIAKHQAGYARAIGFLNRYLGIPLEVLWDSRRKIEPKQLRRGA